MKVAFRHGISPVPHPVHNSLLSYAHPSTVRGEEVSERVSCDFLKSAVRKLNSEWFQGVRSQAVAEHVVSQFALSGTSKQRTRLSLNEGGKQWLYRRLKWHLSVVACFGRLCAATKRLVADNQKATFNVDIF